MKKLLIFIAFLLLIPFAYAYDCTQFKIGDNLFFEVINGTNGLALDSMNCSLTFYTTNYAVSFGNVSTTNQGHGIYNWTINTSLSANKYIATAFCANSIISSYEFCVVSEYTRNTLLNVNNSVNASFVALDSNLQGNATRINASFIGIQTNISNLNSNMANNFTDTNRSFSGTNNYFNSLSSSMNGNFTLVNNSFKGVISSINSGNTNATNYFTSMDGSLNGNFTRINASFIGSNQVTNSSFIGTNALINTLNTNMANNFTDTNRSFSGTNNYFNSLSSSMNGNFTLTNHSFIDIALNVWALATRTLTFYPQGLNASDVWGHTTRNLTYIQTVNANITNTTQQQQLYDASLGGSGVNNSFIGINNNINNLNSNMANNFTNVNSSFISLSANVWNYATRILTTYSWPIVQFPYSIAINSTGTNSIDATLNVSHGLGYYNGTGGSGATAQQIWEYGTRELTALGFKVNLTDNAYALIPIVVWNYGTRTFTDYGTLIADIWTYGTRTLTSFGTIVTDILNPIDTWISGNKTSVNITNITYTLNVTNVTVNTTTKNINASINVILPFDN